MYKVQWGIGWHTHTGVETVMPMLDIPVSSLQILKIGHAQYKYFTDKHKAFAETATQRQKSFVEKLKGQLCETSELVYQYYTSGQYLGNDEEADSTFDALKPVLPFEMLQDLLKNRFDRIHPCDSRWKDQLSSLMSGYCLPQMTQAVSLRLPMSQ